jgi:excisionase family DNA binding protein
MGTHRPRFAAAPPERDLHRGQVAMDRLWGVKEVADYLGVPVGTIYQWRTRNYGPPGRKVGKYVRYVPEQVREWVESLSTEVA